MGRKKDPSVLCLPPEHRYLSWTYPTLRYENLPPPARWTSGQEGTKEKSDLLCSLQESKLVLDWAGRCRASGRTRVACTGKGLLVLTAPAFPILLTLPDPNRDSVLPLCTALGLHCDNASAGLLIRLPRGPLDEVSWGCWRLLSSPMSVSFFLDSFLSFLPGTWAFYLT